MRTGIHNGRAPAPFLLVNGCSKGDGVDRGLVSDSSGSMASWFCDLNQLNAEPQFTALGRGSQNSPYSIIPRLRCYLAWHRAGAHQWKLPGGQASLSRGL